MNILNIAPRSPWEFPRFNCRMPPSICDIHVSDCIVDVHDMTLFTLSNLWNVLIWKSLFTCVFGAGESYLHSPNSVTSSHMHGNVRRSRWLEVGNIPRITLLQIRYMLHILIFLNDRGRVGIDHGLARSHCWPNHHACSAWWRGQPRLLTPNCGQFL